MAELAEFRLSAGETAPDFALPDTEGKVHRLSDVHEPLFLAVFWCNHCPYVQAWESRMIDLGRRYGGKGVAIFLINANDTKAYPADDLASMRTRAHEKGYPFPYLRDESQEVARAYGALVTPHALLFDRERRLLFQGRIDDSHDHPERVRHRYLEKALDQALAGSKVEPSELPVLGCTIKWKA